MLIAGIVFAQVEKDISIYFSQNYQEARSKFIDSVKSAGGNLKHYRNPNSGTEGGVLYTDVATFNLTDATTVLVLGSGTHGVEGFAGVGHTGWIITRRNNKKSSKERWLALLSWAKPLRVFAFTTSQRRQCGPESKFLGSLSALSA